MSSGKQVLQVGVASKITRLAEHVRSRLSTSDALKRLPITVNNVSHAICLWEGLCCLLCLPPASFGCRTCFSHAETVQQTAIGARCAKVRRQRSSHRPRLLLLQGCLGFGVVCVECYALLLERDGFACLLQSSFLYTKPISDDLSEMITEVPDTCKWLQSTWAGVETVTKKLSEIKYTPPWTLTR